MSDLLNSIKNEVKKSGTNKGKFMYFREGQKQRVRFLADMDDGMEVAFHDSFEKGVNVPCQETFGRNCPYCEEEDLRTRSQYVWSVYNYEAKEVQLFMFPVNNCTPLPALVAMYENYGTLTDRDYVISVSGKGPTKTYNVVPMDKVKFRNAKATPFASKAILKMIDKAYPSDIDDEEEEDEYEEAPKRPSKKGKKPSKKPSKPEPDEDDDYDGDWEDDGDEQDYSEMSAKELYKLCKDRDIEVETKKPAKYYIKQLEEADKADEDWGDEDDDDGDWEDE